MKTCQNQSILASLFVFFALPVLLCSAAPSVSFVADTAAGWDYHELDGDIARNNTVDWADLSIIAQQWLASGCGSANQWCSKADIDGSGGVDLVDYTMLAKEWTKQGAKDVLLQTIYGTAQDSSGTITANTYDAIENLKGNAMAFAVPQNTTLDKAIFKCFKGSAWLAGDVLKVRFYKVTGQNYLSFSGHPTVSRANPGGSGTLLFDINGTIPSSMPYHSELGDGRRYIDVIINFGPLEVTAGEYLIAIDRESGSNTTGSTVVGKTSAVTDAMGKYGDGVTPLPKRATVSASGFTGNAFFYELASSTDINYTPRSYLYAFQITIANQPPVVNAGTDQTILTPNNIANLSGTASDDGFPDPPGAFTTTWSKVSGPGTVTFGDASALNTTATFSDLGTYGLRLTANDGQLSTSADITVTYVQNQAPEVDAGTDRTVGMLDVATVIGTVTDDGLPNPPGTTTKLWTQQSGPGTATFGSPNAAGTTVTFSATGTYVLRLTASDSDLSSYDEITITVVEGSVNNAPIVNAGADQIIADPINSVTLNATAVDDGLPNPPGVMTTQWTKQSGPGTVTFGSTTAIVTTATFSTYGTYVLRLTASDSSSTTYDEVTVYYTPPDAAPVVNAGINRIIVNPTNSVNLDGTVTDDGLPNPPGVVTTTWTMTSGPGTVTFGSASAVDTTATFSAYGTYVLRLTANDGALSTYDEMTVAYYETAPPNQAPVVNAGMDKQFHLPAMAQLNGSVTDDNLPDPPATVTTVWTQQSGPATATITSASSPITTVSFPQDGTYVFRLTANDSDLSSYDEVTVTVLPPISETVYHVTNLNDSGTGSLRDCLNLANTDGVRSRIVFDVSGTIHQASTLIFTEPNTTICGTTAPSPGITIDLGWNAQGFTVNTTCSGIRLCNLKVQNSHENWHGIQLSGSNNTIERCTFLHCQDEAVGINSSYGNIVAFTRMEYCGSQPNDGTAYANGRAILLSPGGALVVQDWIYHCNRGITLNTGGFVDVRNTVLSASCSPDSGSGFTNAGGSGCYSNVINCEAYDNPCSGFRWKGSSKFYRSGNSGAGNCWNWPTQVPPDQWLECGDGAIELSSPISVADTTRFIPMPQWLQENLKTPKTADDVGMGTGPCQCIVAR